MRVCVYATPASIRGAGINRFSRMVLTYLPEVAPDIEFIYYYYYLPIRSKGSRLRIKRPNLREVFMPMPSRVLEPVLRGLGINNSLFYGKADIFYIPDYRFIEIGDELLLYTIHDLSFVRFDDILPKDTISWLLINIRRALNRADHFITVSESSKRDIIEYFSVSDEKISVVYNGFEIDYVEMKLESGVEESDICIDGDYILSVGTLNPNKNYIGLLKAYKIILDRGYDIRLVIVGRMGWKSEEIFNLIEDAGLTDRVIILTDVSDRELKMLYRNAHLFVFPSFYEGFGIPPLEASAYNIPVVCSGVSSLPEVMGDSALYFDPYEPEDMADKVIMVIEDTSLRKRLIGLGRENLKRFSWKKTASSLASLFRTIYDESH